MKCSANLIFSNRNVMKISEHLIFLAPSAVGIRKCDHSYCCLYIRKVVLFE